MILLPLLNTSMPANTGMFFNRVTAIAAFDIYEVGEHFDEWFVNLPPSEPVNEKFETVGMESLYFMNNMGSFIIVILFKMILGLIWLIL